LARAIWRLLNAIRTGGKRTPIILISVSSWLAFLLGVLPAHVCSVLPPTTAAALLNLKIMISKSLSAIIINEIHVSRAGMRGCAMPSCAVYTVDSTCTYVSCNILYTRVPLWTS